MRERQGTQRSGASTEEKANNERIAWESKMNLQRRGTHDDWKLRSSIDVVSISGKGDIGGVQYTSK